jgi:hypothetical protein
MAIPVQPGLGTPVQRATGIELPITHASAQHVSRFGIDRRVQGLSTWQRIGYKAIQSGSADAFIERNLVDTRKYVTWLAGRPGVLGETGIPYNKGDVPQWNTVWDAIIRLCEANNVWFCGWQFGEFASTSDPLQLIDTDDDPATAIVDRATVAPLLAIPRLGSGPGDLYYGMRGIAATGGEGNAGSSGYSNLNIGAHGSGSLLYWFNGSNGLHTLNYMKNKGFSYIRIPFAWERVISNFSGDTAIVRTTELQRLIDAIKYCGQVGLKAVIDMHSYCRYIHDNGSGTVTHYRLERPQTSGGTPWLTTAKLVDSWTKIIQGIQADSTAWNNLLAIEVMNEPASMGGTAASPAGFPDTQGAQRWQAASQTLVNAIRALGVDKQLWIPTYFFSTVIHINTFHPNGPWLTNAGDIRYVGHDYFAKRLQTTQSIHDYGSTYAEELADAQSKGFAAQPAQSAFTYLDSTAGTATYEYRVTAANWEGESTPSATQTIAATGSGSGSGTVVSGSATIGYAPIGAGTFSAYDHTIRLTNSLDRPHRPRVRAAELLLRAHNLNSSTNTQYLRGILGYGTPGPPFTILGASAEVSIAPGAAEATITIPLATAIPDDVDLVFGIWTGTGNTMRMRFDQLTGATARKWWYANATYDRTGAPPASLSAFVENGTADRSWSIQLRYVYDEVPGTIPQLVISATQSPLAVNLAWDAATNASGYRIRRALLSDPGTFTTLVASQTARSFSDTVVAAATGYRYEVLPLNGTEQASAPTVADITTPVAAGSTPGGQISVVSGTPYGASAAQSSHPLPANAMPPHQAGDLLELAVTNRGSATISLPSGWTRRVQVFNSGSGAYTEVWTRRVGNGETVAAPTITLSSAFKLVAVIRRLRGGDPTTELDVAIGTLVQTTSTTSIVAPARTTVTANALATYVVGGSFGTFTHTWTGATETIDAQSSGSGGNCSLSIADEVQATPGDTGGATATSSGSTPLSALSIVYRPLVEVTPGDPTNVSVVWAANLRAAVLTWTAAANAVDYLVRRAPVVGGVVGPWVLIGPVGGTTYQDEAVEERTTYRYDVQARNGSLSSARVESNDLTIPSSPPAPPVWAVLLTQPHDPRTEVPLWIDAAPYSRLPDQVQWRRATAQAGPYTTVRDVQALPAPPPGLDALDLWTDTGLVPNTTYWYQTRAKYSDSEWSAWFTAGESITTAPSNQPPALDPSVLGPGWRTGLSLRLLTHPTGIELANWSAEAQGLRWSHGAHGCERATWTVDLDVWAAFRHYAGPVAPYVEIADGATVVWSGRLEDVTLTERGITCTALGLWRDLSDAPYTAHWSSTDLSLWEPLTPQHAPASVLAGTTPDAFEIGTSPALRITAKKGARHHSSIVGYLGWAVPARSSQQVRRALLIYQFTGQANWAWVLQRRSATWALQETIAGATGAGTPQSGTIEIVIPPAERLTLALFRAVNDTGIDVPDETGAIAITITAIRILSTTTATLDAGTIVRDVLARAHAVQAAQDMALHLSLSTALIRTPAGDLQDRRYVDASAGTVLTDLAALGDAQGLWETGVGPDRRLYFRRRGSAGRTYHLLDAEVEIERSADSLINSVYGRYTDSAGNPQVTQTATDARSVRSARRVRETAYQTQTRSDPQVERERDALLADSAQIIPQARISVRTLTTPGGARVPLWLLRPGDTVIDPTLPPGLGPGVDRLRSFVVAGCDYDSETDTLTVTPEAPPSTLQHLLARVAVGFGHLTKSGSAITAPRRGGSVIAVVPGKKGGSTG